jgi:pesticin/yersiniabactin receptor
MSCAFILRHRARSLPLIMSVAMLGATAARAQQAPEATVPLETLTVEGQATQPKKAKGKKSAAKKQPAQSAPSAPSPAPDLAASAASGAGTRVVTSSKRAEDPLDVPAGIDVATPADLTPRNFTNLTDLDRVFVDTNIRQRSNRAYTNMTVRGQSSVDFYNPSVGIYIDGLPQDQTTFGQLLPLGLDHVELLYGPQGTLYGRNAIGGVLDIVTKKPGNEPHFEAFTEVTNLERGGGVLASAPIIKDVLYGDVALAYKLEEGEYVDQLTLDGLGDTEDKSGRVRLRYAPKGGPLDVMVMAARSHVSSDEERFVPEAFFNERRAVPDAFFPSVYRLETNSFGVTASYDLGPATISSRSSYQDRVFDRLTFGFYTPEDQKTFNQEVTIASDPAAGQPIDYLFGLYYQNTQFRRFARFTPPFSQTMEQDIETYAAFGEVTWHITNRLDLTGGIRYEYEESDGNGFGMVPLQIATDSDAITPKVALDYKLTESWRLYALYSTGFKPGGIVRNVVAPLPAYTYDPQTTDNFEVGTKYRSRDGRTELWAAAYYNVSEDYQLFVGAQPFQILQNAGEVEAKGINVTAKTYIGEDTRVSAGLGLNETKFTEYRNPAAAVNYTGNTVPYAPEVTVNGSIEHMFHLGNGLGALIPHFGVSYVGEIFFDESNTIGQGAYTLLDAGLTWQPREHAQVNLFVDNITDKTYAVYGFNQPGFGNLYQLGQGRLVGASLKLSY